MFLSHTKGPLICVLYQTLHKAFKNGAQQFQVASYNSKADDVEKLNLNEDLGEVRKVDNLVSLVGGDVGLGHDVDVVVGHRLDDAIRGRRVRHVRHDLVVDSQWRLHELLVKNVYDNYNFDFKLISKLIPFFQKSH